MGKTNKNKFVILENAEISVTHIQQALNLDYEAYENALHLTLETCIAYFKKNKDIYLMLFDTDNKKIIAYLNVSPITNSAYEKIRSGIANDTFLTANDILNYESGKDLSVYFSSIVVEKNYRKMGLSKILINRIIEKLSNLILTNVKIKRIIADAISRQGEYLCKKMGMKKLTKTQHDSVIYELLLENNFSKTPLNKKLYDTVKMIKK